MADPTTNQTQILLPIPQTVVGPLVIGSWINWMLFGAMVVQAYYYAFSYKSDKTWLRILVYVVVFIDGVQTFITSHTTWYFAVKNWNNNIIFTSAPWSTPMLPTFAALVSGIVQPFYAWRIWVLSTSKWMRGLAIVIVMVSFTQALCGIVGSSIIQADLTQERLLQLHPVFNYWLAGSFVADILITGCMIYILLRAKTKTPLAQTEGMVNKLISNSIQTGLITAACAGVDLALFVSFTSRNYHYVPAYILGKLYTNSLLATLNSRRSVMQSNSGFPQNGQESFGMRLQVTRVTERTTDSETINTNWTGGKVDLSSAQHSVELGTKSRLSDDA